MPKEEAIALATKSRQPSGTGQKTTYAEYQPGNTPKGDFWFVWRAAPTDKNPDKPPRDGMAAVQINTGAVQCDTSIVAVVDY